MWSYFVVEGVTVDELNLYLASQNIAPLPHQADQQFVAIRVFCMGWSWAVWGGETTTEDIIIQNSKTFRASMRVRYGAPAPRISPTRPVAWASHLDDVFAWSWGIDQHRAAVKAFSVAAASGVPKL